MCITKILSSRPKVAGANSYFTFNESICLVVEKVLTVVYDLQLSFCLKKLIFEFFRVRKVWVKAFKAL